MAHVTQWPDVLSERETATITAVLQDADGVAIASTSIDTATLTLYEKRSLAIINGREVSDILNTGGGTIDAEGNLTLDLSEDDMAFMSGRAIEIHVALIEFTYDNGDKKGKHLIEFQVENLHQGSSFS